MLAADVSYRHMTDLIRPGGRVASIGVHGNPAALHLEKLWPRDVTITTGLVDTFTAPTLVRLLSGGRIDASIFVAQRYALEHMLAAYDTLGRASEPSGPERRSTSAYELRTPRLPFQGQHVA